MWIDESTRPRTTPPAGGEATPAGRMSQRTLVQVHQHLRSELDRVRQVAADVAANRVSPQAARELVNRTAMRQNQWTLGAFCAAYCRVVSVHHTIEDEHLFPSLRDADGGLRPVLDQLAHEHELIAAVLDGLDVALVAMVNGETDAAAVVTAVDELSTAMLSHLAYEEEQLLEPIGRLSIVV